MYYSRHLSQQMYRVRAEKRAVRDCSHAMGIRTEEDILVRTDFDHRYGRVHKVHSNMAVDTVWANIEVLQVDLEAEAY